MNTFWKKNFIQGSMRLFSVVCSLRLNLMNHDQFSSDAFCALRSRPSFRPWLIPSQWLFTILLFLQYRISNTLINHCAAHSLIIDIPFAFLPALKNIY
jgi:hypothetical protein